MSVRQFTFHEGVASVAPNCSIKELHDKCESGEKLTVAEKQEIFDRCREYRGVYRLAGWEFNFRSYMKRYIVRTYDNWSPVYAFNSGNIRKNIYTRTGVEEIYEIPNLLAPVEVVKKKKVVTK